jgi:hypothetical protein
MSKTQIISIQLTLQPLPAVAAGQLQFGVQRGKTVVKVQEMSPELTQLTVTLEATAVLQSDNSFDWKGPYVHGRPGERFLYLNWGWQQADGWQGMRRAKIPLGLIPSELVKTAVAQNSLLHGTLDGIARDGGPVAASVKSVAWHIQTSE